MFTRYVTRMGITLPVPPRYVAEHVDSRDCLFRELQDAETADHGEHEFEYRWLYLPTGETGVRRIALCGPHRIGYELLRRWNRRQTDPPAWVYT